MGYLTPILIRNDSLGIIQDSPETLKKIISACQNPDEGSLSLHYWTKPPWWKFWEKPKRMMSGDCNPMESLGTRHADISRVIVVSGNTWIDLSGEIWKHGNYPNKEHREDETHFNYIVSCIKIAKETIKQLETILKNTNILKKGR
jgi:hypothetical protein